MKITARLVLAFVLVALFAAGLSAYLGSRAAEGNVERFLRDPDNFRDGPRDRSNRWKAPPPVREQQALLARLRQSHLQTALIALAVAILTGGYLAYRFVRPLRTLTQTSRRYAAGERSVRAKVDGHDEIAELGQAFNQLVDQVASDAERERRMVADIAHELRTPLTVLRGELEALQDGVLEATPDNFARLVSEVDLLTRLVQDLRLLSLSDSGQLTLSLQPVNLAELVQEALDNLRSTLKQQTLELNAQAQPILHADPERLKQVLYNLLHNALQHGQQVQVGLRVEGATAVLEVSDDGGGIPPEHLPHLFERFYRADAARKHENGNTGLGLAIVKALVEAHGGRVDAANRAVRGAVFRVELPLYMPS